MITMNMVMKTLFREYQKYKELVTSPFNEVEQPRELSHVHDTWKSQCWLWMDWCATLTSSIGQCTIQNTWGLFNQGILHAALLKPKSQCAQNVALQKRNKGYKLGKNLTRPSHYVSVDHKETNQVSFFAQLKEDWTEKDLLHQSSLLFTTLN